MVIVNPVKDNGLIADPALLVENVSRNEENVSDYEENATEHGENARIHTIKRSLTAHHP